MKYLEFNTALSDHRRDLLKPGQLIFREGQAVMVVTVTDERRKQFVRARPLTKRESRGLRPNEVDRARDLRDKILAGDQKACDEWSHVSGNIRDHFELYPTP